MVFYSPPNTFFHGLFSLEDSSIKSVLRSSDCIIPKYGINNLALKLPREPVGGLLGMLFSRVVRLSV
jgi:hypothetical protein